MSEDPACTEGKLEILGSIQEVHSSTCDMQLHIYMYVYMVSWDAQDSQLDSVLYLSESLQLSAKLYGQVRLD